MQGRSWFACFGLLTLLGCTELPPPEASEPPKPLAILAAFDAASTGSIRGRVCWDGDVPLSETTVVRAIAYHPSIHLNPIRYETTHLPRVHPQNRGVADAVVFLRGIDPQRARPWDHDEVSIEFRDRQMVVFQAKQKTNAAFVRRGDKLTTVNHDQDYHALRGRGAAFFTLPLIKPEVVSSQPLKQVGLVDLFDAGGYYWSHAHLFVDDHPYYARTNADGHFVLEQVPPGKYEIVSWMPSWIVTRKEIDPETAVIARFVWAPPQEQKQTLSLQTGKTAEVTFRWERKMFENRMKECSVK